MINKYYRPDIDGLRGIAVLAVNFFNFDISFFKGGFLGVDIFFVISGYLITNLILREINEGNFKILIFFERRIRRIVPALFTVIIISIPLAYYNLSAGVIKDYWQSVLSSLLFYQIIFLLLRKTALIFPQSLNPYCIRGVFQLKSNSI